MDVFSLHFKKTVTKSLANREITLKLKLLKKDDVNMTHLVKDIDHKIALLKEKKKQITAQQAHLLLKTVENLCGKDAPAHLGATIITHAWKNASSQQKEEWKKSATHFCFKSAHQKTQTTKPHPEKNHGSGTSETSL